MLSPVLLDIAHDQLAPSVVFSTNADDLALRRKKAIAQIRKVLRQSGIRTALKRVLDFARHETLRKISRHFSASERRRNSSTTNAASDDRSLRLAFDLQEFSRDFWPAIEREIANLLQSGGQELFDELGRSDPWELPAQETIDFIRARENMLRDVPDEIHQQILDQLTEGLDEGETLSQLSDRISHTFDAIDEGRADVIANTETTAAYGFSRNEAMKAAGVQYKKWLHTPGASAMPRPTHEAADGQVVPIDQPFNIGGAQLMYPGDDSGGPEETINCHCVAIPIDASEAEGGDET